MPYTEEAVREIESHWHSLSSDLHELQLCAIRTENSTTNIEVKKHLTYGIGRRLKIINASLHNIFSTYPPNHNEKLSPIDLDNLNINLHAFLINICGIFDNFAWVFVYEHGLTCLIENKYNVGLFNKNTKIFLPENLKKYLSEQTTIKWHREHLKAYRDALAHSIPLYIPPIIFSKNDVQLYSDLNIEINSAIKNHDWDAVDQLQSKQSKLGQNCDIFLTDASNIKPVYLHSQLINDTSTLIEFGKLFFQHWKDFSQPSTTQKP